MHTHRLFTAVCDLAIAMFLMPTLAAVGAVPAPNPTTVPVKGPEKQVSFLTMGDWGRNTPEQHQVADTMAATAEKLGNIQAVILAGDNFYVPLAGVNDPAWQNVFEKMYDAKRLNVPFFAALGNHDYEANKAQIEIDHTTQVPNSRWKLPARWYRINIPADKPVVTILMLDSNKQVATGTQWADQMAWIDKELTDVPAGTWTICCAHHPLFSNGAHGDNGVLQTEWGPIMAKHHVDFYLCGHDHDIQHLEIPGQTESFVLVGGGGAGTRAMRVDKRGPFSRQVHGFAHFLITPEKATVRFIDKGGAELHTFERTKAGAVTVLATTPSDKATTQQLKAVQGIDGKKSGDD